MELTNKELYSINGGVSGAVLSNVVKGAQLLFDLGKSFGSAIRRFISKNYC